jgi:hypothetical protein
MSLEFHTNISVLKNKPEFKALVAEQTLEALLADEPNELTFKIDATQCEQDFLIFQVVNGTELIKITLERNIASIASQSPIKAVNLEMVRDAIAVHQDYLPSEASANAGFDVIYYPSVVLTRYPELSANVLKSITDARALPVLCF